MTVRSYEGAGHAGLWDSPHSSGNRRCRARRFRRSKNPARANVDGNDLHDDLQCPGGALSNRLRRSRHAAFGRRDHHQQRHGEHDVLIELQHRPARVSDKLCAAIAFSVKIFRRFDRTLSPARRSCRRSAPGPFPSPPCPPRSRPRRDGNRASRYARYAA